MVFCVIVKLLDYLVLICKSVFVIFDWYVKYFGMILELFVLLLSLFIVCYVFKFGFSKINLY